MKQRVSAFKSLRGVARKILRLPSHLRNLEDARRFVIRKRSLPSSGGMEWAVYDRAHGVVLVGIATRRGEARRMARNLNARHTPTKEKR